MSAASRAEQAGDSDEKETKGRERRLEKDTNMNICHVHLEKKIRFLPVDGST